MPHINHRQREETNYCTRRKLISQSRARQMNDTLGEGERKTKKKNKHTILFVYDFAVYLQITPYASIFAFAIIFKLYESTLRHNRRRRWAREQRKKKRTIKTIKVQNKTLNLTYVQLSRDLNEIWLQWLPYLTLSTRNSFRRRWTSSFGFQSGIENEQFPLFSMIYLSLKKRLRACWMYQ